MSIPPALAPTQLHLSHLPLSSVVVGCSVGVDVTLRVVVDLCTFVVVVVLTAAWLDSDLVCTEQNITLHTTTYHFL